MRKTEATTNSKLKLVLSETKSAEENKSVSVLPERVLLRVIKLMLYVKMLITSNMSLLSLERRRLKTKTTSTD